MVGILARLWLGFGLAWALAQPGLAWLKRLHLDETGMRDLNKCMHIDETGMVNPNECIHLLDTGMANLNKCMCLDETAMNKLRNPYI